jgi:short-subunit dehydrogenase involved in D-alanine esterification of teichoic acids
MTLAGKTVAITGADGGIGRALHSPTGAAPPVDCSSSARNIVMAREPTLEDF